jgi:putative phosphoesterase
VTKIAIISDVHSDVEAVRDALRRIDAMACDHVFCAGDLVDYGAHPEETIALLRERGVPCIRGNHDRWVFTRGAEARDDRGVVLSAGASAFLSSLPTAIEARFDGVRVAVHHGSPRWDMAGIDPHVALGGDVRRWLAEADADVLVVGHTHVPFALTVSTGGLIVNPGALLRDSAGRRGGAGKLMLEPSLEGGTFGVLLLPQRTFTVYRAADGSKVDIPRAEAPEVRVVDRRAATDPPPR